MEKKNIIIASNGTNTMIFYDGKVYGDRITKIAFSHEALEIPKIVITADDMPVPGESDLSSFKHLLESIMGPEEEPILNVDLRLDGNSVYRGVLEEAGKMKENVYQQIDRTIFSICKAIQDGGCYMDTQYAETVKSLAALVEARAKLNIFNPGMGHKESPCQVETPLATMKKAYEEIIQQEFRK